MDYDGNRKVKPLPMWLKVGFAVAVLAIAAFFLLGSTGCAQMIPYPQPYAPGDGTLAAASRAREHLTVTLTPHRVQVDGNELWLGYVKTGTRAGRVEYDAGWQGFTFICALVDARPAVREKFGSVVIPRKEMTPILLGKKE